MRAEPIVRLPNGNPRFGIVPFYAKGKPPEYCVYDRRDGAWMMPRTTDIRDAAGVCDVLSRPGDVPVVEVPRVDIARQVSLEV